MSETFHPAEEGIAPIKARSEEMMNKAEATTKQSPTTFLSRYEN
jgi:hypothetical protein